MTTCHLHSRLAQSDADIRAVQALRYAVFVEELGGNGTEVDHVARLERDRFDPGACHLMLEDPALPVGARCVGTTRIRREGDYYTASEYDISPLEASGRPLIELGRACLHRDYRGGAALSRLWSAVAAQIEVAQDGLLFGVASFHGTDVAALAQPLSWLHHHHLAPKALRPRTRVAAPSHILPLAALNRRAAVLQMPALLKAYLRMGAMVGEGAFVDHDFNCTDVCVMLETRALATGSAVLSRSA